MHALVWFLFTLLHVKHLAENVPDIAATNAPGEMCQFYFA